MHIKPTIGRVVWFTPGAAHLPTPTFAYNRSTDPAHQQACAATVAYVHSDSMVNLRVTDHNGHDHAITSVPLVQEGDTIPSAGFYCEWMPYQKGQAAKAESSS